MWVDRMADNLAEKTVDPLACRKAVLKVGGMVVKMVVGSADRSVDRLVS